MIMRLCWQALAVVLIFLATPCVAALTDDGRASMPDDARTFAARPLVLAANETKPPEADINTFASMTGKCTTLKIAGRDFGCRAVAFFHSQQGRANFTVALDDPSDSTHVISFSGENGRRDRDNLFELPVDRMLLSSRDRPKLDGLPVPSVELSSGTCRQIGNIATQQISSISCSAVDRSGKKYELQFESDGTPMTVRRIRQSPLKPEKSAKQIEQLECRRKADVAKVLPRDWTAFVIRCLAEEDRQTP
jgi:hypothetical protein